MTTKQAKASGIHQVLAGVGMTFDPATIIAIITAIVQLFQGCGLTPAQAERRAQNPRLLDRLVLRRRIKDHVSDDDDIDTLHAAFLDAGADLTVADVTALYADT